MSDRPAPVAPRYLRTPEAAVHLSLSATTLEKHRCYGTGPKYHKLGGRIVYAIADLDDWAAIGRKTSTSDPGVGTISPLRPGAPLMRAQAAPPPHGPFLCDDAGSVGAASPASGLTEVELTWIEQRLEHWIRFGRVAADRIVDRRTRISSFRPGAVFAFVRWSSNDFGTIHSSIAIVAAVTPGAPYATHPFIRPGGELLMRVDGWPKVQQVLMAIDAIEAGGVDPCDVAPDHWSHIGSQLAAGLPFRPYGPDRHAAWLRRRAIGA